MYSAIFFGLFDKYFEPSNKKKASSFSGAPDFLGTRGLHQFLADTYIALIIIGEGADYAHPLKLLTLRRVFL